MDREKIVAEFYEAFNHHDMDSMEAQLAPEVDWTTADGRRERGRAAFRSYWNGARQAGDIRIEPMQMVTSADGVHVRAQQVATSSDGTILENKKIEQIFGFDGVFISRIDVIDRDPNPDDEDEDGDGDGDA